MTSSTGRRRRWHRHASSILVVALLFGAGPAAAQQSDEREVYLRLVSTHFQLPTGEAERLLEERIAPDELPVVLFLQQESGIASAALLAMRRSGTPWSAVARRSGIGGDRFHIEIPESAVDARVRRIHQVYASTPRGGWSALEFTDDEIVTLVHLRVLTRRLGVPVPAVIEARAGSASWIGVPSRLAGGARGGT